MSVRGTLGGVFAAAAVIVIGWQVGSATSAPTAASAGTSGSTTSGTPGSTSSGTTTAAGGTLTDGTYTGDSEQTRFGNVQVKVTVSGGRITEVAALQLTDREFRSVQISNQAAPILRQEVLSAQSAKVDYVSGATYTSDGYLRSVQSALDQAS